MNQTIFNTDVLIVGGGIAGVFAALKAREQGSDVIVVDKGTVGKSGLSPWFGAYQVFEGSDASLATKYRSAVAEEGEYLVNQDYIEMFIEDSEARYQDLAIWGAAENDRAGGRGIKFRNQVKKSGVRLIERTMITELLKDKERIIGVIGFSLTESKVVVIYAKAVVLCSGSGAFKTPGFPIGSLTHDGDAMAYRIGAEISGKEFIDFHWTHWENPADGWSNFERNWGEFHKEVFDPVRGHFGAPAIGHALEVHNGDIPVFFQQMRGKGPKGPSPMTNGDGKPLPPPGVRSADLPIVGGATAGMAPHKCEGIFPANEKCQSNVAGLFAAGDALCTAGATYSGGIGFSASGSAVQGARAGMYASEYVQGLPQDNLSDTELDTITQRTLAPLSRKKGYNPSWVTQVLQGIMVPYYVLYIKRRDRLEAALTNIAFLRDHFADRLMAKDAHELRLVHETRNMVLNAEMKLRASLYREETRGAHYREDFPQKDDENWLAWIIITKDESDMRLEKRPVPDKWRPLSTET